ncbi:hypothetical protein NYE24_00505 [Paenibacillus sp. FSL H7-0350]|uniref:hypothetical protein n=1 Tax=Paenibacillus sp. FSL H7-0350 TaxID=2975345 RepID=UPI003158FE54
MNKSTFTGIQAQLISFLGNSYPAIKFAITLEGLGKDSLIIIKAFDTPNTQIITEDIRVSGIVEASEFWIEEAESPQMIARINERCETEGVHSSTHITGWTSGKEIKETNYLRLDYNRIKDEIYSEMHWPSVVETDFNDDCETNIYHMRDYKGNLWQTVARDEEEALGNVEMGEDVLTFIVTQSA